MESTRFIVVEEIGLNVLHKHLYFLKSIIALLEPPANTPHRYVGTTTNSAHKGFEQLIQATSGVRFNNGQMHKQHPYIESPTSDRKLDLTRSALNSRNRT